MGLVVLLVIIVILVVAGGGLAAIRMLGRGKRLRKPYAFQVVLTIWICFVLAQILGRNTLAEVVIEAVAMGLFCTLLFCAMVAPDKIEVPSKIDSGDQEAVQPPPIQSK